MSTTDTHIHLENKTISRHFFFFLWIMYAVVYMTKNCYSAATAAIVAEGILTKTQTGLITTVFYLIYTPLQILGGVFADKYNPERMVKIGLIGSGIANAVIFFNQNYYVMLGVWAFNAVIQFPLWPSVFKIMTSQLVRSDRKTMVFLMSFSSSAGLLLAYLVAAFIPKWQYNFLVSALLLFSFALVLQFYYNKYVETKMLPDKEPVQKEETQAEEQTKPQISTGKLFLISGFFAMFPVVLLRSTIEQGIKVLAPTMLMESYENVSPMIGNLMGMLPIVVGLAGILISRLLCPKYIRNEIGGYVIFMLITLPFLIVLSFIGVVPISVALVSMSMITMLLTTTHLFGSYLNMSFVKYGKNGLAAGMSNAAGSFGIVLYSYCFSFVADNFGWSAVIVLSVVLLVVAIVFGCIAFLQYRRFRKKENE